MFFEAFFVYVLDSTALLLLHMNKNKNCKQSERTLCIANEPNKSPFIQINRHQTEYQIAKYIAIQPN